MIAKLEAAIEFGLSHNKAARYAGIAPSTLVLWMEDDAFSERIKAADIRGEMGLLEAIKGDKSWQAKAWILERTRPDTYAKRKPVEEVAAEQAQTVALLKQVLGK